MGAASELGTASLSPVASRIALASRAGVEPASFASASLVPALWFFAQDVARTRRRRAMRRTTSLAYTPSRARATEHHHAHQRKESEGGSSSSIVRGLASAAGLLR